MAEKQFGEAAPRTFNKEIESDQGVRVPGLGWEISEETQQEIQAIEQNIRTAEQRSGMFVLD